MNRAALAAALLLAVGMGFGRFAFTGLYPLMLDDGLLDLQSGSLAAAANYAGYLLGALLLTRARDEQAARLCLLAGAGTLLGLALMGSLQQPAALIGVRFGAGLCSALALVGASLWLLQRHAEPRAAPLLFAGVGLGILLSAELLAGGQALGLRSQALWWLLAASGLLLCLPAWALLRRPPARGCGTASRASGERPADRLPPRRLVLVYGLAGFGYIVTATYLPLLLQGRLAGLGPLQVWAAFGLGAMPSCFLWHALHRRLGTRHSLSLNLLLQALGVVLPALSQAPWACLLSALLVGGTFMGTVTIAMPAARAWAAQVSYNLLASMTAAYGAGQIAGPLVAAGLLQLDRGLAPALFAAAATLGLGATLCLLAPQHQRQVQEEPA
ncbi:YbfB/YjiJ family MFS transporter [Pseudomonas sp. L-22-4S-12]|uniref:YbfB/YjiJ family MFS transporter n=1 Tax=Pseudomonas sp. L-22-4S-12 TaxID=2610893 RepID=UPI0013246392|nr:YbfB/YjiJ family MFS transporter [Pseudomonas sp. L-22-4S-12]MWV14445.1 YbfB/YjiJ family MFS transporter [Pseudomonas sp. L-22-4S-12]